MGARSYVRQWVWFNDEKIAALISELLFAIGDGYFPMVVCDVLCNHYCYTVRTDLVENSKAKLRATSVRSKGVSRAGDVDMS